MIRFRLPYCFQTSTHWTIDPAIPAAIRQTATIAAVLAGR